MSWFGGTWFCQYVVGNATVFVSPVNRITCFTPAAFNPAIAAFALGLIMELAAYAESYSNHPISRSLKEAYEKKAGKKIDTTSVSDVEEISGHGVSAVIDGRRNMGHFKNPFCQRSSLVTHHISRLRKRLQIV